MAIFFRFDHIWIHKSRKSCVTFFSAEHLQISPTSLAKQIIRASFRFRVWERPIIKYFIEDLVLNFQLLDKHEYLPGIFRSVILVSIFTVQVYLTFSLFLKIWLTELIFIFRE